MALSSATQVNHYTILGTLGAGGMGEVYRATDTKLKREVALKVLPPDFANDSERLARFQREAELLAALNHNNIAQIHGIESANGITALIMELIEGPTLAERIEQGALAPDEALNIALQICAALEAAHERGIVHRDLKPANIKVRTDGTVKVLDFGIAKAMDTHAGNSGAQSPVLTTPAMTQSGMILGTAAYMSPEQARGKSVDRRADIWAFGCVLYEMLSGQPAFGAEDVPLTLARVLSQATDMRSLPSATPLALRQTIELCLEKDPKKRIADISDVRLALKGRFAQDLPDAGNVNGAGSKLPWLVAALAMLVAALTLWWFRPAPVQEASVNRFSYVLPDSQTLTGAVRSLLAFSPDGTHFVYSTVEGLYLREMGQLDARLIHPAAASMFTPIFSPDGQTIAYFTGINGSLERIGIGGGAPVVIATGIVDNPLDASWAADNSIFYSQALGIYRVSASGGLPELALAAQPGERLSNPELLPDGDTLLFTVDQAANDYIADAARIATQSLSTGVRTILLEGGIDPHYSPTGHLVYVKGNGLFAVRFDANTLTVSGGPVPLVQGLMRSELTGNYGIADDGTLVYFSGNVLTRMTTPVWVERNGTETPLPIEPGPYAYLRIAPDGSRVAFSNSNAVSDLWIWNFNAGTLTLLTPGETTGTYGTWTPDGLRIAYGATGATIEWKAANNAGAASLVSDFPYLGNEFPTPYFFSPSGQELVFRSQSTPGTRDDIGMVTVGDTAEPRWLLNGPWQERNAELSPDGRWMAYQSDESGQFEVYVRPFPNVEDDLVQVSNAGGRYPLWSRDGKELFYVQVGAAGTSTLPTLQSVAVSVEGETFTFDARSKVMDWPYRADAEGRTYDISLDGQRFLTTKPFVEPGTEQNALQIVIVQNWTKELERLVPVQP